MVLAGVCWVFKIIIMLVQTVDFKNRIESYYSNGLIHSPLCHQRQTNKWSLVFHDLGVGRRETETEIEIDYIMGIKRFCLFHRT